MSLSNSSVPVLELGPTLTVLAESLVANITTECIYLAAHAQSVGLVPTRAYLLLGPPGSGKTWIVRRVVATLQSQAATARIHHLSAIDGVRFCARDDNAGKSYFGLDRIVPRQALRDSATHAPLVLVMDDLGDIGEYPMLETARTLFFAQLRAFLDGLMPEQAVAILAAASKPLSDQGRIFSHTTSIPALTREHRLELLHRQFAALSLAMEAREPQDGVELSDIPSYYAERTPGFVARDLALLLRSLALVLMADPLAPITPNLLDTALSHVRPSVAVTEQYTRPIPRFAWTAVGGYEPVVRALRAAVVGPLRRPEAYARIGARAPGGVLLFGPPGCGKSLLVHALASEPGLTVVSVKGPELQSKYFGESEARIRALFADARKAAPCVLFFDEMDVVGSKREWSSGSGGSEGGGGTAASVSERVLSTLLNEMDGVQARNGVVVVGCTSRPNAMDDALLRPGRIDQLILVGLPTELDRLAILKSLPARLAHDVSCATIARHTDGCTGGDLVVLVREAGILAMAETPGPYQPKFISWRHVVAAAREVLRVSLPSSAGPDVPPDQGQMIQLLPEAIESMSLHDPESRSNSDDGGDWEDVEEEEMPTLSNEQRVVAAAAIMQPYLAFLNQRSSSALPPRR